MITEFKLDRVYRPYPIKEGYIVMTFFIFRGAVTRVTYSEPAIQGNGQIITQRVIFPNFWSAEKKCNQLNNVQAVSAIDQMSDWSEQVKAEAKNLVHERSGLREFSGYAEIIPEAGKVN